MCSTKKLHFWKMDDNVLLKNAVILYSKYIVHFLKLYLRVTLQYVDFLDLRNGWQVISPSKSFSVYAATPSEKTEWMSHIAKCAQDLLTKRESLLSFFKPAICK